MRQLITKYFWATAFFGWALILIVLSIISTSSLIEESNDPDKFRWDYLEHFGVFVVFGVLFGFWRRTMKGAKTKELLYFLLLGSVFASCTELLQLFVDGRTFNPVDMILNVAGVGIGTVIVRKWMWTKGRCEA